MPLPDPNADQDFTGGSAYSPNRYTNGLAVANVLASGQSCHYVQPGTGTHILTAIGSVANRVTGEISVQQLVGGRMTTICNVLYDGTTFAQGTWHFPNEG